VVSGQLQSKDRSDKEGAQENSAETEGAAVASLREPLRLGISSRGIAGLDLVDKGCVMG
jgi:hypothetical protein